MILKMLVKKLGTLFTVASNVKNCCEVNMLFHYWNKIVLYYYNFVNFFCT